MLYIKITIMRRVKIPEYRAWTAMKQRCYNPNFEHYALYGGRGITVCDEWLNSYEKFIEDMGYRSTSSHSLDRIDNNLGYFKENCRWATKKEQSNNKSDCRYLTYNGETHTITEWGRITGIPQMTIRRRVNLGWDAEQALTTPSKRRVLKFNKETVQKLDELGVRIADIAYIYKVEVNAIYKLLRKIKNE